MSVRLQALGVVLATLALVSCTTMPVQTVTVGVNYKFDMILNVDGTTRVGMMVAEQKDVHDFEIEAQGDLDLFIQDSCHEHRDTEHGSEGWWIFKNPRKIKFKYTQSPPIETSQQCPVYLSGITEKKGQSSWGFVDFEDDRTTLPFKVHCNGDPEFESNGVAVCQSKFSTFQQVDFFERVMVSTDAATPQCATPESSDGKIFRFPLAKGLCTYVFANVVEKTKRKYGRFTTYGFEQVLLHGSN